MSSVNDTELPVKFSYFRLRALGLPSMIMLTHIKSDCVFNGLTHEEWGLELKANFPTGQLPCVELTDGTKICESGAIDRMVAKAAGLLGEGREFFTSEMIYGITVDLQMMLYQSCPMVMNIAAWSPERSQMLAQMGEPLIMAHLTKFDQFLLPAGDRFTESGFSLGEIKLFCVLSFMVNGALAHGVENSALKAFYDRMAKLESIVSVMSGQSIFGELGHVFVPLPTDTE